MTLAVSNLNELPVDTAAELLRSCCGSSRWIDEMIARRPYHSVDEILLAADQVWTSMNSSDWHDAFAHHPRIGERAVSTQTGQAAAWSADEQSAVAVATVATRANIAAINQEYERRFGHIYIVSAAGKSAEQLLTIAKERLQNDAATELHVAAEEQRQITQLRLRTMFGDAG